MKYVQLVGNGDFDMPYTHSIWVNESMSKKDNVNLNFDSEKNPEKAIRALKKAGFKKLHTEEITYGMDY